MSEKNHILNIFKDTGALLEGHFILSSGKHSSKYFQCAKVLQYPEYLTAFSIMIADEFEDQKDNFEDAFDDIKDESEDAWDDVKDFFEDVKEDMKS